MIGLKDIKGNVIYTTKINRGAKRKYMLMKEDYVTLPFSLVDPISFPIGSYVEIDGIRYEVTDLQKPTLNNNTGGYDYQLRLDAYYWKWKNKIFKFTPEVGGQEASWSLTASLDVHLGIFLRNLEALGYTYEGIGFGFSIDATVENKAMPLTYENMNMIDALSAMAEAWECEWWVKGNIIYFGRCEQGGYTDFEIGRNVAEMSSTASQSPYATRLYVFGSTRNIPSGYRPVDNNIVSNGVVQRRLMLPEGIPYIDANDGMLEEEAIEEVVILDDVYPKTEGNISHVETYEDAVENEDGSTTTETFYRFKDEGITFSSDYILEGEGLKVIFTSGSLNGMEFALAFNPNGEREKLENGSWNPEAQLFEIVVNEDYGRKLPDSTLNPKVGDKYILIGWDSTKIADLGLVSAAEEELHRKGLELSAKRKIDPNTYNCKMFSDYMYGLDDDGKQNPSFGKAFEVGDRVTLLNKAYFENGRKSRIIGYEYNLDIPFDNPIFTVGESAAYSRIGAIESKLNAISLKGQNYEGNGGNINVRYFLRKDKDDRSRGTIASDKGFEVGRFVQGMLGGSGAKVYVDDDGKTTVEADRAYFREEMLVPKITFNSIDVVSGEQAATFAYGTIRSVDTERQIATLDLLEDEYGTIHVYDILRGTFHRLEGGNNTEYSLDENGFHNYSGFSTSYFTPTEILKNEKGVMEFRYSLQKTDGVHPCAGMNFYAYGNFSDKNRQSITYRTREYERRLVGVNTWVINPNTNIKMQNGNLDGLEVGNFKMSGWGTFETNSYLMGTQIQFSPDQLEELKGLNGADAYSVTLSSYDGVIKVDAEGNITSGMTSTFNVTSGTMNVVTGGNNVVATDFRLKTVVQASKGNTPLFYSTGMEEGSYMAFIAAVGCDAEVEGGIVSVTEITDLKNASLTITVVCEGSYTVEKTYRINAVYDGSNPVFADIDNEMDSVACDSDGNVLFGLPVSCNVSMWYGSEELGIGNISLSVPDGVTVSVDGQKIIVSAITREAGKTLPVGIAVTSSYGGKTYTKNLVFTVNKIVAGENSLLYKLNPSVAVVKVSNTGEMSVGGVSCDIVAFDGKTTEKIEAPLPSDLSVKHSINGEEKGDYEYGSTVALTKDDKELEFKLYNKGVCIDTEGIPVVKDGDSSEIETIYSKEKEPDAPENVHPYVDNDTWSHEVHEDNIWMAVSTRKNNEWTDWQVSRVLGVSSFKSTAFIRTNTMPETPVGGSYESPFPTDRDADGNLLWSDGIPEGESILWASVCTFVSNGHYPEDAKWSTPRAMTDTADFEAIYSPKEIHEDIPDGFFKDGVDLNPEWEAAANALGWYDDPNQWNVEGNGYKGKPTIWMATNTAKNGVWEGWKISRVLGEKGADGVSYEITPPSLNLRETLTGTVTPVATTFTCYSSNQKERVATEATWRIKGRKDGQEDWATFDYSHVGESMIFEPNQQDRYDEYLITAIPKGQTTALEVQVIATKDRRGVMPRYCGRWKEGTKYYYNDEVRDIVTLGGSVFQVYPYNPDGYVTAEPNPDLSEDSHDDYWEKANKFSFVAMDTALIDSAHIAGFTFFVDGEDENGNPLGRMESANGRIVLDTLNETIKSTNADIEGSITAGSMSYRVLQGNGGDNLDLTGYGMASGTGSYMLPDIEEGKTLQVRALCANYSGTAVKFAFRVWDDSDTKIYVRNGWTDSWGEVSRVALGYNSMYTFTSAYDNVADRWVWILTEGMGANGAGESLMVIDAAISSTSINPVQNKVIYEKFQSLGPFTYNKDYGYWTFNGDLLVQGGVTSHANGGKYTPSTIMDGVQVDWTTIVKDENGNLAINPDIDLGGGGSQEMTARQILDKLVTIDGSGSGLDADKIDGFESSRLFVSSRANMNVDNLDTFELRNSGSVQVVRYSSSGITIDASPLYTFRSNGSYHGLEIYQKYNATAPEYMVRSIRDTGSFTPWKTLAFLDSTVENAKYATSAGKLSSSDNFNAWGQVFFSNGVPMSVSGNMSNVGNITSQANNTYTLGSSSNIWKEVWASVVKCGTKQITFAETYVGVSVGDYAQLVVTEAAVRTNSSASHRASLGTGAIPWNGIYLDASSAKAYNEYGVNFGDGSERISSGSGFIGMYATSTIVFRTGGTTAGIGSGGVGMNLDASGNLLVTGGVTSRNTSTSSDIRYKEVHKDLELSLDKMADAPSFEFHFKDDELKKVHIGTSAQYWQDIDGVVSSDEEGKLNMDYSSLGVSMAVSLAREVRSLKEEILELRKEIELLKNK